MAANPLVSFVMPVWRPNVAWLQEAVISVLAQDACEVELIVVDDGNPEPVRELLADLEDRRIRHLRVPRAGQSAARNAGTAAARGAYVRSIDADDVLPPGGTAALLRRASEATIAHGYVSVCDQSLRPVKTYATDMDGDAVPATLLRRFKTRHVAMLIPTAIARATPWDTSMTICADADFVLRCVERLPVTTVGEVVYLYRRHGDSVTHRPDADDAARRAQARVIRKFIERHPELRRSDLERQAWRTFHDVWATRSLDDRRVGRYLQHALQQTLREPQVARAIWGRGARHLARGARSRMRSAR